MNRLIFIVAIAALALSACSGAKAKPTAGATFSGPIHLAQEKASSATLTFTVSDDGSKITNVGVMYTDLHCDGMSAGSMQHSTSGEYELGNTLDISPSSIGHIQGNFSSPTKASGTIDIKMKFSILGSTQTCDLGAASWEATAE